MYSNNVKYPQRILFTRKVFFCINVTNATRKKYKIKCEEVAQLAVKTLQKKINFRSVNLGSILLQYVYEM